MGKRHTLLVVGTIFEGAALLLVCVSAFGAANSSILAGLGPDEAIDLGGYSCVTIPGDQPCEGITDYSGMVYSPKFHQILMFGGGHATTFRDDVDVFHFDSLSWKPAYNPTPCSEMTEGNLDTAIGFWRSTNHAISRHTYDMMNVVDGELIVLNTPLGRGGCAPTFTVDGSNPYFMGKPAEYDIATKAWRPIEIPPTGSHATPWHYAAASEYDPESSKIIILGEAAGAGHPEMWAYDPLSTPRRAWKVDGADVPGSLDIEATLIYYPPNQKMYYIRPDGTVFEVTLDRKSGDFSGSSVVELETTGTPPPEARRTGYAYDAASEVIGGGVYEGRFYSFDPKTRHWTETQMHTTGDHPIGSVASHALAYDNQDDVYIFITGKDDGSRTWAYRFGAGLLVARPLSPTIQQVR